MIERNGVHKPTHSVELVKRSRKRLNGEKMKAQIDKIIDRAMAGGRMQRGWKCQVQPQKDPRYKSGEYLYDCKIVVANESKKERKESTLKQDWDNIIKFIGSAGNTSGWEIHLIDNKVANPDEDERIPKPVGYVPVEIPDNWKEGMSHIFDRDSQIEIIMSAIQAGINSEFQDRFHCALIGQPACGKTETLRSIKNVLGEDAVLEYDATATTQAGAIKDLDTREDLPRILIVEEIEKTDENSLRWLLSVMDHRAEIRKVNYRESIQRETRLLTLATVNDYKLFKKIMFGALASRFAYHIHFPRPDRALLQLILEREVARVRGDKRWIKPTLDFAVQENIFDPRKVTAICLCGREQLLDKTYQTKLKAVSTSTFDEEN